MHGMQENITYSNMECNGVYLQSDMKTKLIVEIDREYEKASKIAL